jgi:hypothetical protein
MRSWPAIASHAHMIGIPKKYQVRSRFTKTFFPPRGSPFDFSVRNTTSIGSSGTVSADSSTGACDSVPHRGHVGRSFLWPHTGQGVTEDTGGIKTLSRAAGMPSNGLLANGATREGRRRLLRGQSPSYSAMNFSAVSDRGLPSLAASEWVANRSRLSKLVTIPGRQNSPS